MNNEFDMALVQRGARLRRTPFFEATQQYGARGYTVYNHTLFPICYDDFEAEYWKLVEGVTLWDVGVERQVEITGPDAARFVDLLITRDLSDCRIGQARYVILVDDAGGIINDPVLLRLGENHFWLSLADSDVLLWARGVARISGLQVNIREPDVWPLQVQGPRSRDVLEALFGEALSGLGYYEFVETDLDGIPLVITRTGWSGELGYELYLRGGNRGVELWERVMAAGKPFDIAPAGPSDIRRIEAGILNYGADMTLENNPYEVGLGWLVDLDRASDFIGREALHRIRSEGVHRKLVGIRIEGPRIEFNMTRWPVFVDQTAVGQVTSAIFSPRLDQNIGYAMVELPAAELGTRLSISIPQVGVRPAEVVPRPFVDPKKKLPKA